MKMYFRSLIYLSAVVFTIVGCVPEGPDVPTRTLSPVGTPTPIPTATDTPGPTAPPFTPTRDPAALPAMRIAFMRYDPGAYIGASGDLWVMDANGANQRLLARYEQESEPGGDLGAFGVFSPDGCLYAMTSGRKAIVVDVPTGEKVVIDKLGPDEPAVISNFVWSPDSSTLTYYRGGGPGFQQTVPQLRRISRSATGSWGNALTIPLDPSGRVMLPVWQLGDGRMLTQMYGAGPGFGPVSYITDLTSGVTLPLTLAGSDQLAHVTDVTPDGRIVFETPNIPATSWHPDIYTGQITAGGVVNTLLTLSPHGEDSVVFFGKFTPDGAGVLAGMQHGLHGGLKEYGLFTPLADGTTRYTSLLPARPVQYMGHSPLGSRYAVVSVSDDSMTEAAIWLLALDGSLAVTLTDGFFPVALPVCEN